MAYKLYVGNVTVEDDRKLIFRAISANTVIICISITAVDTNVLVS